MKVKVVQSCPTLCNPMDFTVCGILQAKILEWVSLLQGLFPTQGLNPGLPAYAGRFLTSWATREAQAYWSGKPIPSTADLPDPGIKPGSPTLQADSLLTELWGKPYISQCGIYFPLWYTCFPLVWVKKVLKSSLYRTQ